MHWYQIHTVSSRRAETYHDEGTDSQPLHYNNIGSNKCSKSTKLVSKKDSEPTKRTERQDRRGPRSHDRRTRHGRSRSRGDDIALPRRDSSRRERIRRLRRTRADKYAGLAGEHADGEGRDRAADDGGAPAARGDQPGLVVAEHELAQEGERVCGLVERDEVPGVFEEEVRPVALLVHDTGEGPVVGVPGRGGRFREALDAAEGRVLGSVGL